VSNNDAEKRAAPRLHIDRAFAVLHVPNRPSVVIQVVDFSERGICARLLKDSLDNETYADWHRTLVDGRRADCELSEPILHRPLHLTAVVCHVKDQFNGDIEMGIAFVNLPLPTIQTLKNAALALAQDKLRVRAPEQTVDGMLHHASEILPGVEAERVHEPALAGMSLGEVLIHQGLLTPQETTAAESQAWQAHMPLHRWLLKERRLRPNTVCRALALSSGLAMTNLRGVDVPRELGLSFGYLELLRYECVPLAVHGETVCLACAAPLSVEAQNELEKRSGKKIMQLLAPVDQIRHELFMLRPRGVPQDRRGLRIPATLPVRFEFCDDSGVPLSDEHGHGVTVNVSEHGVMIALAQPQDLQLPHLAEQRAMMRCAFAGNGGEIHANGCITHAEQGETLGDGLSWRVGIEFIDLQNDDAKLLKDLCMAAGVEHLRDRKTRYYPG
jgi:hypothetical protein